MNLWKIFISRLNYLEQALRDLTTSQRLIFSGALVGFSAGISVYIFDRLIVFATEITLHQVESAALGWKIAGILIFPLLGAVLGALLIAYFCPEAKGHGVNEVFEAIAHMGGRIRGQVAWVKSVASALTIGLGGSAGREGPVIQIGASIGSWIGQRLNVKEQDLRVLAAAGASAGLAAAFGTPLTAVFFTMEVVLRDLASESFAAVVIASVTGAVVARSLLGNERFIVPLDYHWSGTRDFLLYATLGLLCAPLGTLYIACLRRVEKYIESVKNIPSWLLPGFGGLFVGAVALLGLPEVMGTGQVTINSILRGSLSSSRAGVLALAKIAATIATLGTGGSGGALMPALFIGVASGAAWGGFFRYVFHLSIQPGAFALVGMSCVVTSTYQAPVTGMILALEISQDYEILMPVMIACVVAHLITRKPREIPVIDV